MFVIVGFVTLIIFKRELHTVSESVPSGPFPLLLSAPHPPGRGAAPFHPGCSAFPSMPPPFLRCVEPPVWFQIVHQLGWGGSVRGHSLWGRSVTTRHRVPADHTFSQQISFLGGLALNEGVNWLIKHVIQEPRPCGGRAQAVGSWVSPRSGHYREAYILPL